MRSPHCIKWTEGHTVGHVGSGAVNVVTEKISMLVSWEMSRWCERRCPLLVLADVVSKA